MCRLESEAGGEMGVPAAELGSDCTSGGSASRSGIQQQRTVAGDNSGPELDGVLVTERKWLCVCCGIREPASDGPGDSVGVVNMVSKLSVLVPRYGLVVLTKMTEIALDQLRRVMRQGAHYT